MQVALHPHCPECGDLLPLEWPLVSCAECHAGRRDPETPDPGPPPWGEAERDVRTCSDCGDAFQTVSKTRTRCLECIALALGITSLPAGFTDQAKLEDRIHDEMIQTAAIAIRAGRARLVAMAG